MVFFHAIVISHWCCISDSALCGFFCSPFYSNVSHTDWLWIIDWASLTVKYFDVSSWLTLSICHSVVFHSTVTVLGLGLEWWISVLLSLRVLLSSSLLCMNYQYCLSALLLMFFFVTFFSGSATECYRNVTGKRIPTKCILKVEWEWALVLLTW